MLIPPIRLAVFEDNSAVIAIVAKGYSAKLSHLAKTHRVNVASMNRFIPIMMRR